MSDAQPTAESSAPPPQKKRGITVKEVVAAVVVVVAVVFCFLNTNKYTINFFGYKPHTYIWLWMIILLAVGILVGMLLPYGRQNKKK